MSNLNQITLIGRVGKEVEVREVGNGKVANFTLAVSEKYKNKAGEQVNETEWFDCVVWNKPAEVIEKYVSKGDLLFVQGKIKTRSWEKDGVKHYAKDVVVSDFKFFPKPNENNHTKEEKLPTFESNGFTEPESSDLPF